MGAFMRTTLLLLASLTAAAGLALSQPVEAKRHDKHYKYEKHGNRYYSPSRVYLSSRDVIYLHGIPSHRYTRAPVYIVRNRYGDPISYYVINQYRDRYYDDHYDDYSYRYRDNRYDDRYRYQYRDRDGLTVIYRR
jgi:hypothetical protein